MQYIVNNDILPEDKMGRSTHIHVFAVADLLNLGTRSFWFTESQYKAEYTACPKNKKNPLPPILYYNNITILSVNAKAKMARRFSGHFCQTDAFVTCI